MKNKIMSLFFGSPCPHPSNYQIGIIDILCNYTKKELIKERKKRLKLYKKDWKNYHKNRKKELTLMKKLIKEIR